MIGLVLAPLFLKNNIKNSWQRKYSITLSLS
jgi:hypothetical protein